MQFKNIIGQKQIQQKLMQLVSNNRLSHALLLLGKEGSGALSLAIAFAQYIVCEKNNKKPNEPSLFDAIKDSEVSEKLFMADSCGECAACKKASQLVHPDIHYSYPVVTKKTGEKPISTDYIAEWRNFVISNEYGNVFDWLQFIDAENKQGNITANECADIIHKLSLKSYESEYKILIMWLPEYLGKEGNKLLKLIEEPPANTLFLFVAENQSMLLPTIVSRLQLIKIPPIERDDLVEALKVQFNLENDKALPIAQLAEGNFREAKQIMLHADDDWNSMLREWLNTILKTGPLHQVKWIEDVSKLGREKQKQFLKYFIHLLELAIRQKTMEAPSQSSTEYDFAQRLNKITSIEQQEALSNLLNQSIYYIERNANAKMLFHALTIQIYHIISNNSLILIN